MDWDDVKGAIAGAAPLLGTLIGGPAGTAVGGLIAAALGADNNPDAIHAAVKADPEAAIKLAQIEADNRVQLQQLAVTAEANRLNSETRSAEISVDDRKDARDRDKVYVASGKENHRATWMIILDVVGLLACLGAIVWILSQSSLDGKGELLVLLTTIANFFGLSLRDAHQFEFGSSRGSEEKSILLAHAPAVEVKK